jgi:hypothetical protein
MAIPNDCYNFLYWQDEAGRIMPFKQRDTIKLRSDSTLIAVFEKNTFLLTLNKNIANGGNVAIIEENDCINSVIKVIAADCYKFLHWQDTSGKIISEKQIDTITLTSDSTLVAVFEEYYRTLTLNKNIDIAGNISQTEIDGCAKIIRATPNECYRFLH